MKEDGLFLIGSIFVVSTDWIDPFYKLMLVFFGLITLAFNIVKYVRSERRLKRESKEKENE